MWAIKILMSSWRFSPCDTRIIWWLLPYSEVDPPLRSFKEPSSSIKSLPPNWGVLPPMEDSPHEFGGGFQIWVKKRRWGINILINKWTLLSEVVHHSIRIPATWDPWMIYDLDWVWEGHPPSCALPVNHSPSPLKHLNTQEPFVPSRKICPEMAKCVLQACFPQESCGDDWALEVTSLSSHSFLPYDEWQIPWSGLWGGLVRGGCYLHKRHYSNYNAWETHSLAHVSQCSRSLKLPISGKQVLTFRKHQHC